MSKSWQFLSGPGSAAYGLYDTLRRRLNRALVDWMTRRAPARRVLEAGSGPAFASSLMRRRPGVELSVALDIDLEALREARRRDPALPVVVGDLRRMPFARGAFDLVWNSSTMEHLEDMGPAIEEMKRAAGRDGFVFIGVPALWGPLGLQRAIRATTAGVWIGTVFSRGELAARLARHGLRVRRSCVYFFGFFVGALAGQVE